ncbi:PEP/pyruvate-binding domain-containing protein [Rubrobacter xylanophilus]|uniref:PEP/pyruvate-binding domain-containing protein n=1 Tax=Rubrobacter xylanophilus TaxID=49319 RepID=UPI001C63E419|nr:PEP/pyruvate-binding domain-containing protein [Rubrobacter xylanophilus]
MRAASAVLWFNDEACRDVRVAGGKGASLARMIAEGLPVPPGFVVPAHVLEDALDTERARALAASRSTDELRKLVASIEPPEEEIKAAYENLVGARRTATYKVIGNKKVAVRSSAVAEDSEAASYAGQQETFLYVEGAEEVCRRVVDCWASFFSERALFYRAQKGSLEDLRMAVVVQRMVDPEKSGVIFTADPVRRRRDRMVVEAVRGVGEQVVSGEVTPDHYSLDRKGKIKRERIVADRVLTAEELRKLAELGRRLEELHGVPQDIEWAIVGGEVFLLQSRPVTTL